MAPVRLTWSQVLAWRTARQHLVERLPDGDPVAVARRLGGLHAQVSAAAEWAALVRTDGLARDAVDRALWEDRTLVRLWAQRGTLHLLPVGDLPAWTAAQGELRPRYEVPAWLRHHGLTRPQAEAIVAAIPVVLDDGPLTREALAAGVAEHVGDPGLAERLGGGFGDLLKPAAFRGELCFAPPDGRLARFARPDRWLPEPPAVLSGPEGTAALVRRWLGAYGPGTREVLARWFGMTSAPQAGRWIAALGDEVEAVEVDGQARWALAADVPGLRAAAPSGVLRLLPGFDPYVVAAPRDVDAVLPAEHRAAVYRPQGWLSPVLLRDGRIAGTWTHTEQAGALTIGVVAWEPLEGSAIDAVSAAAERLAEWLGLQANVTFG